jgi:maltooligosyltrehalose synthase
MAKGVEDTATYRYHGLLAQADVGADPDRTDDDPEAFHRFVREREGSLNATSTHDSKRNEDARCRLAVLSEADVEWAQLVGEWHRRFDVESGGVTLPHAGDQLVVFQSLLALWPPGGDEVSSDTVQRVTNYCVKAAREAKQRTSWVEPDAAYEETLPIFVARVSQDRTFRGEMAHFSLRIGPAALTNMLGLLALKVCTPGTPDIFQGCELMAPALTDPDNRRPVDYECRRAMLAALPQPSLNAARMLLDDWHTGDIKLYVTRTLLGLRRSAPELLVSGSYEGLTAPSRRVVAWLRTDGHDTLVCVVPRMSYQAAGAGRFPIGPDVWGDAEVRLPNGLSRVWADVLTGRRIDAPADRLRLADVLDPLPLAVLRAVPGTV